MKVTREVPLTPLAGQWVGLRTQLWPCELPMFRGQLASGRSYWLPLRYRRIYFSLRRRRLIVA